AALGAANHAAGNAPLAAELEITLAGPELEVLEEVGVALGTEMQLLARGQRLRTGPVRRVVRAYLAVEGGLSQPLPGEPVRALGPGDTLHRASGPGPPGPRPPAS